jgi:Flp pilus assembly protein TadG
MRRKEQGYVLFLMAAVATSIFGACGLAFDVGRMYIARNELQAFADSAALTAGLRLNGESNGIQRARDEVTRLAGLNKWNMGSQTASAAEISTLFGLSANGATPTTWTDSPPNPPANYSYVRVQVRVNMPVYMISVLTNRTTYSVAAKATAGQLPISGSPIGMFPFTPIAHSQTAPDFGLAKGQEYTLRWPSSPKLQGNPNVCVGDQHENWLAMAALRGAENRGFYGEQTSASVIWDQVANDTPVQFFNIGQYVVLTGGAKTTVKDALVARINADPDHTSNTWNAYKDQGHSRRLITVPITLPTDNNRVLGFGRFFLYVASHYENAQGNDPWCAVYIGPGSPEGSDSSGASSSAGLTRVRLADE